MRLVLLVIAIGFFLATVWAVRFHFSSQRPPLAFVALSLMSVASLGLYCDIVWRRPPMDWRLYATLGLFVAAVGLFGAAVAASRAAKLRLIFDKSAPTDLVKSGPYAFIRHPFYTSYMLFWLGCAIATLHSYNFAFFAVLIAMLTAGAIGEERSFETSPHAEAYARYRATTGMFWPRLWR